MIAGIALEAPESRWKQRPAFRIIAFVVATTLLVFAVQTYALRVFDRRREAVRPKPVAEILDEENGRVE